MKRIADIRRGLNQTPGALVTFPPDSAYRGPEPGVQTSTIWEGEKTVDTGLTIAPVRNEEQMNEGDSVPEFTPMIEIGANIDETFPALGGEEGEGIRQSILIHGMDALGWYASFHVTGVQWGSYVKTSGIAYVIHHAFANLQVSLNAKAHLAFHAILNHELFHFATDYAVAQAELVHQEPWWIPAKVANKSSKPSYCVLEEQLANAYMLKAFRTRKPGLQVPRKQAALRRFIQDQPEGYRDGWRVKPADWERKLAELAGQYGKHSANGSISRYLFDAKFGYDWASQFPMWPRIDWRYCPIHLVQDGAKLDLPPDWLTFFSQIICIQYSDKFRDGLQVLAPPIQKAWERTKEKLKMGITAGADFKKWPKEGPDVYSIRINDRVRAHLQYRRLAGDWLALRIGGHKELGHG